MCVCAQKEDAEKRLKNLEEAKQIVLTEDTSLPAAKQVGTNAWDMGIRPRQITNAWDMGMSS